MRITGVAFFRSVAGKVAWEEATCWVTGAAALGFGCRVARGPSIRAPGPRLVGKARAGAEPPSQPKPESGSRGRAARGLRSRRRRPAPRLSHGRPGEDASPRLRSRHLPAPTLPARHKAFCRCRSDR